MLYNNRLLSRMPTKDPVKNREYVKASNMKKKEQLMKAKGAEDGTKEYNEYFAIVQQKYRENKKETEEKAEVYKRQQADYMKQYRAKKKQEKGANTLIGAWKAHQARKELQARTAEKANNKAQAPKRRGRPRKEH